MDRKRFVRMLAGGSVVWGTGVLWPAELLGARSSDLRGRRPGAPAGPAFRGHPDPRPDVDGSAVLGSGEVLPSHADLFDAVRAIPHVADGIGCHCGCGAMPDMRSLLSCYEGIGMAQFCVICSGEGRLAVRLHAEGKTLDEIRTAIDRRFGA